MKIIILNALSIITKTFLWVLFIDAIIMTIPILKLKKKYNYPDEYYIDTENQIDYQKGNECAAFSSAYILRYFNINANGIDLYKKFPCKFHSGSVSPLGIRILFKKYGFKTNYYKGNMNSLKAELKRGVPIIAFLHSSPASKVRHFVPVTGYDQEGFYLAESIEDLKNILDGKGIYNRKVYFDDFKKMWNIKTLYMPFYSYTYMTITPKQR